MLTSQDFSSILENIPEGVTVQDLSGKLVYANSAALRILGQRSPSELSKQTPATIQKRFTILDEEGNLVPVDKLPGRQALRQKKNKEMVLRFSEEGNAQERWSLVKAVLLKEKGRITGVLNTFHDFTSIKNSELMARKFKTVFEESLDAIMITDNTMKIVEMNAAAIALFRTEEANLKNRKLLSFISEDEKTTFSKNWKKLRKQVSQRAETDIERGDRTSCPVEYSAKAEFLPSRNVFILRDISGRKKEELRRDHLLGIVSHELRTPLASIKAFAEILHRRPNIKNDAKSVEYLAKIDDKTGTLAQLVSNLLDMTRLGGGTLELYLEMFDFDVFFKELLKDIQMTLSEHKVTMRGKTGVQLVADCNRIGQVITNLVKNAAKYSPGAEEIIVRSSVIDDQIRFSVQDFGLGITQREQRKIFDMFYRAENVTEKRVVGLGVGLYISAEIVKKHGGKIWVRSKKGEGSTFFVSLPLHPKK